MSTGSYVGLRVLYPSHDHLFEYCQANGIPADRAKFEKYLHATVIHSRKYDLVETEPKTVHVARFASFDLFDSRLGQQDILVVKLNAPSVVERHEYLMAKHGFTYDFPEYHPHVSLSYNFTGDIDRLPPIDFPILLGLEYHEQLRPNWAV